MADGGGAEVVQRLRVIQLAKLNQPTDGEGESAANDNWFLGDDYADQPKDHHRPQRIAGHVTHGWWESRSEPMHDQADTDSAQRERGERAAFAKSRKHAGQSTSDTRRAFRLLPSEHQHRIYGRRAPRRNQRRPSACQGNDAQRRCDHDWIERGDIEQEAGQQS